jgi:hypothetical protein
MGNARWEYAVVFGPQGVGAFRMRLVDQPAAAAVGWLFPAQPQSPGFFQGNWDFLRSGGSPDRLQHSAGRMTFSADQKMATCSFGPLPWACTPDKNSALSVTAGTDGGIESTDNGSTITWYGYRAPNGALAAFGGMTVNQADGSIRPIWSALATQLKSIDLPAAGAVTTNWDLVYELVPTSGAIAHDPVSTTSTILGVDSTAKAVLRKRNTDGREEVVRYNTPIAGVNQRVAGSWNGSAFPSLYEFAVAGMGLTLSVNADPFGFTTPYTYGIGIRR